jgi:capsular exopolysaccharide synthesis family protein
MEQSPETRSLRDYLRAIMARRWLVIATTLAAIAASILFSLARSPVYEATATLGASAEFNQPQGKPATQGAAGKEAALEATSPEVLGLASLLLRGQRTPRQLHDDVSASGVSGVNEAEVKAKADSAGEAAQIANVVAAAAVQVTINQIVRALEAGQKNPSPAQVQTWRKQAALAHPLRVTSSAVPPGGPVSPRPLRDAAFAGLLGLLLGLAIALIRDALDQRVTDPHELEATLGFPVLGYVRSDILGTAGGSPNGTTRAAAGLDSFRILRTNAELLVGDGSIGRLAVTSPLPDEGRSTVAAWYAYVNALAGKATVLVECDLHRPVVAERFGLDPSPGLAEHLAGDSGARELTRSVVVEGSTAQPLSVIPAGAQAAQPAELLASARFEKLIDELKSEYELVVLDCPPLLPMADTLSIVPQAGGILMCVRLGQTTRDQAIAAKDALGRLPQRPVGLVLTDSKPGIDNDYSGYQAPTRERVPAPS